jgi:hypothetical protein
VESLGFSSHVCIPFISFSCLLALPMNSSTILNKGRDSGHPCFIPGFRGKAVRFSHSAQYWLSACLFHLPYVLSIPTFFGDFIVKG